MFRRNSKSFSWNNSYRLAHTLLSFSHRLDYILSQQSGRPTSYCGRPSIWPHCGNKPSTEYTQVTTQLGPSFFCEVEGEYLSYTNLCISLHSAGEHKAAWSSPFSYNPWLTTTGTMRPLESLAVCYSNEWNFFRVFEPKNKDTSLFNVLVDVTVSDRYWSI